MSVYYELFVEADVRGKRVCISPRQINCNGVVSVRPVVEGTSNVGSALHFEACTVPAEREDLSEDIRSMFQDDGSCWGLEQITGHYLAGHDYEQPDVCGFAPRDVIANMHADPETEIDEVVVTPEEFASYTPLAQRGFAYIEYTIPFGPRDVMRRIKRAAEFCVRLWNNDIYNLGCTISLDDVHVIVVRS